jgi:hypothetical protein
MRLLDFITETTDYKRNQRPLVAEAIELPETEYGYWITDEGEFLDVPYENHAMVAHRYFQKHPEKMGPTRISGYERAFELGWIRIIDRNRVNIRIRDPKECTPEALRSLLGYIGQVHKDNRIFIDLGWSAEKLDAKVPHLPTRQEITKYLMRVLIGKRRPQMVAEAQIPETDYGYWITHDGQMLPVSRQAHEPVAERYLRAHPELGRPKQDAMTHVLDLGWIRIIDVWQHSVSMAMDGTPDQKEQTIGISVMDPRKVPLPALNTLLGYLRQTDAGKYYMDAFDRDIPNKRWGKNDVVNYFKQLFFRAKKQQVAEGEIPPTRYGYWITDKGEFIPVRGQYHQMVADQYFPKGDGLNRLVRAYRAGWIRVVQEPRYLDLDIFPKAVRRLALYGALKLIKQAEQDTWPEPLKVIIDQIGVPSGRKQYDGEGEANAVIRSLMPRMVAEGKNLIPQTDYGYWITHTGEFIKVDFQEHDYVANQYFPSGLVGAEQSGWVRVIEGYTSLEIDIPARVTKDALYRVLKLINTMQPHEIAIDVAGPNGDDRYGDFKDIGKANAFVRQFMPKGVAV